MNFTEVTYRFKIILNNFRAFYPTSKHVIELESKLLTLNYIGDCYLTVFQHFIPK